MDGCLKLRYNSTTCISELNYDFKQKPQFWASKIAEKILCSFSNWAADRESFEKAAPYDTLQHHPWPNGSHVQRLSNSTELKLLKKLPIFLNRINRLLKKVYFSMSTILCLVKHFPFTIIDIVLMNF